MSFIHFPGPEIQGTHILRLIEESDPTPGAGAKLVNRIVADRLEDWLVHNLYSVTLQLLPKLEHAQVAKLFACVAVFLCERGCHALGLRICEEVLKELPQSCQESASVLGSMGGIYMKMNSLDTAMDYMQRSITMRVSTDPNFRQTAEYARRTNGVGVVKRKMGDLRGALSCFEEAKSTFESTHVQMDARSYSMILGNIGFVYFLQGELSRAMSQYEEAVQVRKEHGAYEFDPDTALILNSIGEVRMQQTNVAGALDAFEEAWKIREHTKTDMAPAAGILRRNLEEARRSKVAT